MLRLAIVALIAALIVAGEFAFGFAKVGTPTKQLADLVGVVCGLGSACLWGVSVIGNPAWNSIFNYFAAAFAALALGYSTSPTIFG